MGISPFAIRADRYGLLIGADDRLLKLAGMIIGKVSGFLCQSNRPELHVRGFAHENISSLQTSKKPRGTSFNWVDIRSCDD